MLIFLLLSIAFAQTTDLNERLDKLEQEVRTLRAAPPVGLRSVSDVVSGLGPVASKIYFAPEAEYVFGLGAEFFTFTQRTLPTGSAATSVASLAPLLAVRFSPRLLFNSQLVFENGGSESRDTVTLQRGASIVKFAYLEWLLEEGSRESGVRLGHQLVPVGLVNTSDDPTTFFGVLRPELERDIIPSSWHENGLAFWVDRPGAELQLGVFTSLNSAGYRGPTFLAGGRSQGQNGVSEDLMAVLRANARGEHFLAGVSTALGNSGQGNSAMAGAGFKLFEAHARFVSARARVTAQYAQGEVDDADSVSIMNSTVMGARAKGYSLEGAWAFGDVWLFARTSRYNLHDRVPPGWVADPALLKTFNTFGLSWFPLPTVVLKADYQTVRGSGGGLNLGAGFVF